MKAVAPRIRTLALVAAALGATAAIGACTGPGEHRASEQRAGGGGRGDAVTVTASDAGAAAAAGSVAQTEPEASAAAIVADLTGIVARHRDDAARIIEAARTGAKAHDRLRYVCDHIGPRLSGSEGLERAIEWCAATLRADGMDEVRLEKVMVPVWVRGEESVDLLTPRTVKMPMLALGGSVGTPPDGITADVVVVKDFDALDALIEADADAVRGKIVAYDFAMRQFDPKRGAGYGEAVNYRVNGASRAAQHGAVAVFVRSVTARSFSTPHTGMLSYNRAEPQIPAAAITIEHSQMLSRLHADGARLRAHLVMGAHSLPDAPSANVIAEIRGSEFPEEIVVIGGHIDSWDVGHGAHDDGGACMAVMDALRIIKELGLKPRRTIRGVLYTNEENGLRGARAYVGEHSAALKDHVMAIEADSGVFRPIGFRNPKPDDARDRLIRARLEQYVQLLEPLGAAAIFNGGGGADIGQMAPLGVPQLGLQVEGSRYFDYHHTAADTFDKVDRDELHDCVAALAVMAFAIANDPVRIDAE